MKKVLLIFALCVATFANDNNFVNMKDCESIALSKLTSIVSCHQVDYLVEYRVVDDEEKDPVKKVTVVTKENQVVIKNLGR